MRFEHLIAIAAAVFLSPPSFAQYGLPDSLSAEAGQKPDLAFPRVAQEYSTSSNLSNALFAPALKDGEKLPALVIFHACGGIRNHLRYWTAEALKARYVVVVPDGLRGLPHDCGSPSQISNGRLIRDALDAVAHLAGLPFVDASRISVLGFSKGAFVATWLGSSKVANAVRPGTPKVASTIALYGFCALAPTRGRPQGVVILQQDTDRPHLMLLGAKDREAPPDSCIERLPKLKESGAPVEWHIYPDATHAFDQPELHQVTRVIYNNDRVTSIYDKGVTEDARSRIFEFLSKVAPPK